jgi:hypothetical protein
MKSKKAVANKHKTYSEMTVREVKQCILDLIVKQLQTKLTTFEQPNLIERMKCILNAAMKKSYEELEEKYPDGFSLTRHRDVLHPIFSEFFAYLYSFKYAFETLLCKQGPDNQRSQLDFSTYESYLMKDDIILFQLICSITKDCGKRNIGLSIVEFGKNLSVEGLADALAKENFKHGYWKDISSVSECCHISFQTLLCENIRNRLTKRMTKYK